MCVCTNIKLPVFREKNTRSIVNPFELDETLKDVEKSIESTQKYYNGPLLDNFIYFLAFQSKLYVECLL